MTICRGSMAHIRVCTFAIPSSSGGLMGRMFREDAHAEMLNVQAWGTWSQDFVAWLHERSNMPNSVGSDTRFDK